MSIKPQELTLEGFRPYGHFVALNNLPPNTVIIGGGKVKFHPDLLELDTGGANPTFSTCVVEWRDGVVDVSEIHECGELILPLNGDILIHVGSPTLKDKPPLDHIEIFRVPKLTAVVLHPGVWHHAPFALGELPVITLIGLPRRTYHNDCTVVELSESEHIRFIPAE